MPDDAHSTAPSADCVQRACLFLTPDVAVDELPGSVSEQEQPAFDPDDVTRLVGLQPTKAWRRGDPHPSRPFHRRFSTWAYELAEVRTYCTEEVVTQLLDAIEPHAAGIAEACATLGMRAGIDVVIEMSGDRDTEDGGIHVRTAAVTYTAETVQRLARLKVSVDHDQYIYLRD